MTMHNAVRTTLVAGLLLLGACGGGGGAPSAAQAGAVPEEAVVTVGTRSLRASVVSTMTLSSQVAKQYGIARSDDTVLLLVAVREGDVATAVSVPATVSVTGTDLRGGTQAVAMREVRSGSGADVLVDSIGIAGVTPPETMRFDVTATFADGSAPMTVTMTREFYPR